MDVNEKKLKETMELIDQIVDAMEMGDESLPKLEKKLREITQKPDIQAEDCTEYWSWTTLEDLAHRFLAPKPVKQNLSDEQLGEIIKKICHVEYSEWEIDYQIEVLEVETGLDNVSDYIYYPDLVGMDRNASEDEIIAKILADRKQAGE